MCLAVVGEVKSIAEPFALVNVRGIEFKINIQLIERPKKGDSVLIHAGFAIQRIEDDYIEA
jgi:hydrogenase expression/formation protein HypC